VLIDKYLRPSPSDDATATFTHPDVRGHAVELDSHDRHDSQNGVQYTGESAQAASIELPSMNLSQFLEAGEGTTGPPLHVRTRGSDATLASCS
jgi:hypothetical protein